VGVDDPGHPSAGRSGFFHLDHPFSLQPEPFIGLGHLAPGWGFLGFPHPGPISSSILNLRSYAWNRRKFIMAR